MNGVDYQTLFNIAISIIGVLIGWVMKGIKDEQAEQRRVSSEAAAKLQAIEVLVAGSYVKRDDMDKMFAAMFAKLDRIENKVDQKVNRDECAGCHKP